MPRLFSIGTRLSMLYNSVRLFSSTPNVKWITYESLSQFKYPKKLYSFTYFTGKYIESRRPSILPVPESFGSLDMDEFADRNSEEEESGGSEAEDEGY